MITHKPYLYASLGAGYTKQLCWHALRCLVAPDAQATAKLCDALQDAYQGKVYLTYKGRDALELALGLFGVSKRDVVLTQAFTCKAIEDAIVRAGAEPGYVDVGSGGLNLSVATLDVALAKHRQARVVLVQHSLGHVAEMPAIRAWCDQHGLFLLEDIAQAYGACDNQGRQVGTWGDITVCSFGRDKILDAVSGGACIVRHPDALKHAQNLPEAFVPVGGQYIMRDMLYPLWTRWVRMTLPFGVGKILFWVGKWLGILSSPIDAPYPDVRALPLAHASLVLWRLAGILEELEHRSQMGKTYAHLLARVPGVTLLGDGMPPQSYIRYTVLLHNPTVVAADLAKAHIFVSDRWYRKPVDGGAHWQSQWYTWGSCPEAEHLADTVINMPTHMGITKQDVQRLCSRLAGVVELAE